MNRHRSTHIELIIISAITLSGVLLLTRALAGSSQDSTTDARTLAWQRDAPAPEHYRDLVLIADTVASLRRVHVDSTDASMPAAAKPLITTLKHQLRDLICNRLFSQDRDVSTKQLQASVIVDLTGSGVTVTDPVCVVVDRNYVDTGYDYGDIFDVTIQRPHDCVDLIAMTTTIGILCGQDTSLYIFKYDGRRWRLILASETNDYDLISGAQGGFEFGVSPPDENGSFFVVTTSVNPWCTSNWQTITYRVLRPGPDPYEVRELLNRGETIWLCDDPPYKLIVRDRSFALSFHNEKYLEMQNDGEDVSIDDQKAMRFVGYDVEGDSVRRNN